MSESTGFLDSFDYDHLFKILLVGDTTVGKSAFLHRYIDNTFNEDFEPTIGIDFKVKKSIIKGRSVKSIIYDSAGQERY